MLTTLGIVISVLASAPTTSAPTPAAAAAQPQTVETQGQVLVVSPGVVRLVPANAPTPVASAPALQVQAIETPPRPQLLVDAFETPIIYYERPTRPANNNQETVVSATNARTIADAVEADDALLSLPEDSGLKAVFDAERVVTERLNGVTRHTLYKGEVRIVDARGIVRARVSAQEAALQLDARVEHDEVNFTARGLTSAGHPTPVRIHLNAEEGQEESKHGAIRWLVLQPDESGKPLRLKMQFVYDQHKVCERK